MDIMETSNLEGRASTDTVTCLDGIFKMLRCVKCKNLPKTELYILGRCDHKYCEKCVKNVVGNGCIICDKTSVTKKAVPDKFTTKLLAELRIVEGVMKQQDQHIQNGKDLSNNSPSFLIKDDHDEKNAHKGKASLPKKLDYPPKSRLSPEKEEKGSPVGEKAVQHEPGTSEEEDELLSLEVKCESSSSKKEFKKSLNISKLKRRISEVVSSNDENENNDDFTEFKNTKKVQPRQSRSKLPTTAAETDTPVISSTKNRNTKGRNDSGKKSTAVKPKNVIAKTPAVDKDNDALDTNSEIYLFDESDDENDKDKVVSPPCLTPYVKVKKLSNESIGRSSKPSDKRKRVEKPVPIKGKKQKINSIDKTSIEDDEEMENVASKEEQEDNWSPPSLTPYGKANSTSIENDCTTPLRKSKRFPTIVNSEPDTPKSKEKGYIETPKPDKKKPTKKALLNPLKINNLKTPDEPANRNGTPKQRQGQSEATTVVKEVRGRKHSSSSVASSSKSLASTSFSSGGSAASVDKKNAKGETPLHIACRDGQLERAKELLQLGAFIDAQDNAGWTPLHEALNEKSSCRFEIVSLLCENGCKTNIPGLGNETALHEAARAGYVEIVKLLLSYSASPNVRNVLRKLPRDVATSKQVKKILDEAVGFNSDKDDPINSPSSDDPVVLEIEFSKALIYFNYDLFSETLIAVENNLKLKVSKNLQEGVTHIIFPVVEDDEGQVKVLFSFEYLFGVVNGAWLLSSKWIEESLSSKRLLPPRGFEIQGCVGMDKFNAPSKARTNKEVGKPGLFHGMTFYLYKNCFFEKIGKKELVKLITNADGCVVNREPNPDSVDPFETPVRFHASDPNHKLVLTSHVILFNEKNEPPEDKKYNMEHLKVLNVKWLIDSIGNFMLLNPEDYL